MQLLSYLPTAQSGFSQASWGQSFFGLQFDETIDLGVFLTFITLVVGFLGWTYKTIREWRRNSLETAKSGALRLLLCILREDEDAIMTLDELLARFESPEMASRRKAYCGRDFKYKSEDQFESAVYALQWEFKADFVGKNAIKFRMDPNRYQEVNPVFPIEGQEIVPLLDSSIRSYLEGGDPIDYELSRLVRLSMQVAP